MTDRLQGVTVGLKAPRSPRAQVVNPSPLNEFIALHELSVIACHNPDCNQREGEVFIAMLNMCSVHRRRGLILFCPKCRMRHIIINCDEELK